MTPSLGNPAVCASIEGLLDGAGVAWERLRHPPLGAANSSANAAEVRGTPLRIGGKALVLKADKRFVVATFSAAARLDSGAFRRALGLRKLRFATRVELQELTGLVPGCVPPFGRPVLDLPLYADRSLLENARIAFTPGLLDRSIVMDSADWRSVAQPEVRSFTLPVDG